MSLFSEFFFICFCQFSSRICQLLLYSREYPLLIFFSIFQLTHGKTKKKFQLTQQMVEIIGDTVYLAYILIILFLFFECGFSKNVERKENKHKFCYSLPRGQFQQIRRAYDLCGKPRDWRVRIPLEHVTFGEVTYTRVLHMDFFGFMSLWEVHVLEK